MMREAFTADFAFEFTHPVSKNSVALWAHQSVLMLTGAFKTMYNLPRGLDLSFAGVYMFTSARVTEFSLIAHCALLHFLYTGKVPGKIDLREFIILPIPVSPLPNDPVDDLLSSPVRRTSWKDLLCLANRYRIDTLEDLCQTHILAELDDTDAVSTLIEFGNKYPRIRSHAFEYCARGMVQLFERSRDPFATDPENPLSGGAHGRVGLCEAAANGECVSRTG